MSAPFRMDEDDSKYQDRPDDDNMIDGKMVMLPKRAANFAAKFGGEASQRKNNKASIIFGGGNSNDDNSNDEGSQNSSGKFFIDFDDDKAKN